MTPGELKQCLKETEEVSRTVRQFFDAVLPKEHQKFFKDAAQKLEPELYQEVELCRRKIAEPQDVGSHFQTCARYEVVSRKLIRIVSFVLLRQKFSSEK